MRVSIEDAIHGGKSDPRNQTLVKMFTLLGLVERAGSGVPNIFSVWQSQGWDQPVLTEEFNPDRTTLSLVFFASGQKVAIKSGDKKVAIKSGDKKMAIPSGPVKKTVSERQKEVLIGAVGNGESIRAAQVMEMLGVGASRARKILAELVNEETFEASGAKKDRVYRQKNKG